MGLLDGQIAAAITSGFRGKLLKGTLRKITTTGRDAVGDAITTSADVTCEGFIENYDGAYRVRAEIPETDVRAMLIAGLTAATPEIGDQIVMGGGTYTIRKVSRDPAGATFDNQCYRVA